MKFSNPDAAKTFAIFLPRLAEKAPRLVNKQMSLLIEHLDNDVRHPPARPSPRAFLR